MIRSVVTLLLMLSLASVAIAQKPKRAPKTNAPAGRTVIQQSAAASPIDTAQFDAAFASLWQITQPNVSVRDRAERHFKRIIRNYVKRGVDSLAAYQGIMAGIDSTIDRQLFRAALLNQGFTAEDVRMYTAFLRSPTGKKYLAGEPALNRSRDQEIDRYVNRLFSSVMTPMMKPKASAQPVASTPSASGTLNVTPVPVADTAK